VRAQSAQRWSPGAFPLQSMESGGRYVLLVAFSYPPVERVGALRPAGLAKYLPSFGWIPVVLTAGRPEARRTERNVFETPYRDVLACWKAKLGLDPSRGVHQQFGLPVAAKPDSRFAHTRILRAVKGILTYPDPSKGWIPFAREALAEIARRYRIEAIISTAPPFTAHMIASEAKPLLNCPWVADYRDLWNTHTLTMGERTGLAAAIMRRTEWRTIRHADALVTVSEPWAERLRRRYGSHRVAAIANGFDAEEFPPPPNPLTKEFTITHTGQFYEGRRDPTELLRAVRELIDEGSLAESDLRLRFYGPVEPFLINLLSELRLEQVSEVHASIPRNKCLEVQRESQILLLLTWWNPEESGVLTGKVYEYLGSRRPILAVGGGRGAITELLEHTQAGVQTLSKEKTKEVLREWYGLYRHLGQVPYHGDSGAIMQHTHREMARKYAALLNAIARASDSPRLVETGGAPPMGRMA